MRIYLATLLVLLAAVFIHEAEAGWLRRVWDWGKKQICKKPCGKTCSKVFKEGLHEYACSWACNKYLCKNQRRRRSTNQDDGVKLLPLPCDFDAWNLDNSEDGCVDLSEFAAMVNEQPDDPNNKEMFERVDSDGDGCITEAELYTSALHFEEPCDDLSRGSDDDVDNDDDDDDDTVDSGVDDGGSNDAEDGGDDEGGDGGGDDPEDEGDGGEDDGGDGGSDDVEDSPRDDGVDGGVQVSESDNSTDITASTD